MVNFFELPASLGSILASGVLRSELRSLKPSGLAVEGACLVSGVSRVDSGFRTLLPVQIIATSATSLGN